MSAYLCRPRLTDLLERTKERAGITLMCGRSGTGKSVVAADFSTRYKSSSWYSIEPADTDWSTFSNYFSASLFGDSAVASVVEPEQFATPGPEEIAEFFSRCMRRAEIELDGGYRLLVLDNLHHLFDSDWFPDFFGQLLAARSSSVHVLMLCRSKPPLPLWRLRSKQMLNLIDESVLGFTLAETLRLCDHLGLPTEGVAQAHLRSSGRVSKLVEALNEIAAKPGSSV